MSSVDIIQCRELSKTFEDGDLKVDVLCDINFQVSSAERVAIVGRSGAGKSTLLHLLGGLDVPTQGEVIIDGINIAEINETKRAKLRNRSLGFVYQFHHLLPEFSAVENVAMPLLLRGTKTTIAMAKAQHVLTQVGMDDRLHHKPSELSGGERQRAAFARALVTEPKCVLADEPTGNLDSYNADRLHDLMIELNQTHQTSFVIVTHDETLAQRMDRVLILDSGSLT